MDILNDVSLDEVSREQSLNAFKIIMWEGAEIETNEEENKNKKEEIKKEKEIEDDEEEEEEGKEDKEDGKDWEEKGKSKEVIEAEKEVKKKLFKTVWKYAKEKEALEKEVQELKSKLENKAEWDNEISMEKIQDMIKLWLNEKKIAELSSKDEISFYKNNNWFRTDEEFQEYVWFYKDKWLSLHEIKAIYVWENLDKFSQKKDANKNIEIWGWLPEVKKQEKILTESEERQSQLNIFKNAFWL